MDDSTIFLYAVTGFFGCIILGTCCYGCSECIRSYRRRQIKNAKQVVFIRGTSHDRSLSGRENFQDHPQLPSQPRTAWEI